MAFHEYLVHELFFHGGTWLVTSIMYCRYYWYLLLIGTFGWSLRCLPPCDSLWYYSMSNQEMIINSTWATYRSRWASWLIYMDLSDINKITLLVYKQCLSKERLIFTELFWGSVVLAFSDSGDIKDKMTTTLSWYPLC